MATITHDAPVVRSTGSALPGFGFAVLSAASFGLSGTLGTGLMSSGWSAAAAVTTRVLVAAVVLAVPALLTLRGRWSLLRGRAALISGYGLIAVAGCQLAYFNAVRHMEVGIALLIEYIAPVAVVLWSWLTHGHRPGRLTVIGAAVALGGLVLVLDLTGAVHPSPAGVLWALGAMVGAAVYFVLSAQVEDALPPIVLAAGGLLVGGLALLVAGALGIVGFAASTAPAHYDGAAVPWWVSIAALGVITAAVAYVSGIAASRRLGARLASFVALLEVLFALVFAGMLLHQVPRPVQFAGAVLVLAGVVLVKSGERDAGSPLTESRVPEPPAG